VTPDQLCPLLQVTKSWLHDQVERGKFPCLRLGTTALPKQGVRPLPRRARRALTAVRAADQSARRPSRTRRRAAIILSEASWVALIGYVRRDPRHRNRRPGALTGVGLAACDAPGCVRAKPTSTSGPARRNDPQAGARVARPVPEHRGRICAPVTAVAHGCPQIPSPHYAGKGWARWRSEGTDVDQRFLGVVGVARPVEGACVLQRGLHLGWGGRWVRRRVERRGLPPTQLTPPATLRSRCFGSMPVSMIAMSTSTWPLASPEIAELRSASTRSMPGGRVCAVRLNRRSGVTDATRASWVILRAAEATVGHGEAGKFPSRPVRASPPRS